MRERFCLELSEQKLKQFNKEYDQYWAEEYIKKINDEEIAYLVSVLEEMEVTKIDFERVEQIILKTKENAENRIRERQQEDKSKKEEQKLKKRTWTKDDFALLAKALNKYPGGTQDRWRTIASFMGDGYTSKDVIEMAKELAQKGKTAVRGTEEKIIRSNGADVEDPKSKTSTEWSDKEQKLLEEALRKYPKTLEAKERWTKISSEIPGKTPKDCLARFKHIASLLKMKAEK